MHRRRLLALAIVGSCLADPGRALAVSSAATPGGPVPLRSPFAIAAHGERLYVADFDDDRIQVFDASGGFLLSWGGSGSAAGRFRGPAGIAIDPSGSVFVTDHWNHRIQKFGPEGEWLAAWDAGGPNSAPFGVAIDGQGRVLTTDLEAGTVRVWSSDGAPLATWGGSASGAQRMVEPWGIAVGDEGVVLVADHGNHRIQRFSPEGVSLGAWGAAEASAGQLLGPMGLALGEGGVLLVTDLVGDRVLRFSAQGSALEGWGGSADAQGLTAPGVATLGGEVFLADAAQHRILRLPGSAFEAASRKPLTLELAAIAPTPSRGPVTLRLAVPGRGTITADIYSIDGRRVFSSPPTACEGGEQVLAWSARLEDGRRAAAGVYFVHVRFEGVGRSVSRHGRIVVVP